MRMKRLLPAALCVAALFVTAACEQSSDPVAVTPPEAPVETAVDAATTTEVASKAAEVQDPAAKPNPAAADPAKPKPKMVTTRPDPGSPRKAENPLSSTASSTRVGEAKPQATGALVSHVVVKPEALDLGEIPTNDAKAGVVRLVNTGDTAHKIIDCKTSCGCTTANCQKGKMLEPGEEMEVEIKLTGGSTPRSLNKTVTFLVSDQSPLRLQVRGQAIAFVTVEPAKLDPEKHSNGRLVLRAIDDEPFSIVSMYPPIIEGLPTEKKAEHELFISFDKIKEQGHRSTKLLFTLDHPKCTRVYGALAPSALPPLPTQSTATGPGQPTVIPTAPRIDIDKLLSDGNVGDFLKHLESGDIEVGAVDSSGQTPLIKAARWGSVGAIEALLDESADIGAADRIGRTPLMYACQSKNVEAVQVLLDGGADVHARDKIGNTALCWAAGFGDAAIVGELLGAGAEVEVSGPMTGFTPLIWAAGFGDPGSIKLLVDAGANIEAADVLQGSTPLMNAARTGGPDNVRAMLAAGAKLEAKDNEGKTTLLVAASNAGADAEMIKLLIEAGADLTARSAAGLSALDLARKRTDLRSEAVVAVLEEHMQ
ncbi:MAG: ankyrin repeat domain-containing protein [Phycisphaerae bacterium]|nr:ankyrin repeat domain-containing protein [Phycisphaerae bacterium]